jgi:hypothetical protein
MAEGSTMGKSLVATRSMYRRGIVALILSILAIALLLHDRTWTPSQTHITRRALPLQMDEWWQGNVADQISNNLLRLQAKPEQLSSKAPVSPLEELHYALETMQDYYFQLWLGKWPSCIDWTGAVLGTFVSASLFSLSRSLEYMLPLAHSTPPTQSETTTIQGQRIENEINKYFSQSIAYYFGEDAFSIRTQAYDDMLWVVLGWLESVRFVKLHSNAHYPGAQPGQGDSWYGRQFVPAFSHRARVFYDIAAKGWDTRLCGGGMNWNPHLTPYKNAITNELYISASMGMYLDFPGDWNDAPFVSSMDQNAQGPLQGNGQAAQDEAPLRARPHNPVYLNNAVEAYHWLKNSNMTNDQGLYVDGFHIRDWSRTNNTGTGNCDVRNEMVYTYNQGVLLSGLRSLWEGTGSRMYLEDGHALVRNVIAATGWQSSTTRSPQWSGLGRNGILQEVCDEAGTCSQNGQTFKGIFFHHLTLFCEPLPTTPTIPGKTHGADPVVATLHASSCREYTSWVAWNARAAMDTRDSNGRFGMWWGANSNGDDGQHRRLDVPAGAEDYRNEGLGDQQRWGIGWESGIGITPPAQIKNTSPVAASDINDRGRGRTVETQGGGVAVVRAMWEFIRSSQAENQYPSNATF